MKTKSVRRQSARATVMTAVLPKTSRGGRRVKVDIKAINMQKSEGEVRRAAQETVVMKKKRKEGLTVTKSENRTPTETQIQG